MRKKVTVITAASLGILFSWYMLTGNSKPIAYFPSDQIASSNFKKEYSKIDGSNFSSGDIIEFFKKLPAYNYNNPNAHAAAVTDYDEYLNDKMLKSEIMSTKAFLTYSPTSKHFTYKSEIAVLGALGEKLAAMELPNAQNYTFWPVGQRASDFSPIDGGDGIFLVSQKCDFAFPFANEDVDDFMNAGSLKIVLQYKMNENLSKMSNNALNVWANYLESETTKTMEMSVYNPFLFVDIIRIYVFEGHTGKLISKGQC